MSHEFEYENMRKVMHKMRQGIALLNEEAVPQAGIMDNKDGELQRSVMDTDNEGITLTLDDGKTAKVVTDSNMDVTDAMKANFEKGLNGFLDSIKNYVSDIPQITVHVSDSAAVLTAGVVMTDGQPLTISVNSETKKVQVKYDNFLELTQKNVQLLAQTMQYFNANTLFSLDSNTPSAPSNPV